MENIVALSKRRGFIYQGSEIYGGFAGTYDYGPLGVELKNNIKNLWWKFFVQDRDDMYGIDAAIIMNPKTWKATGHVESFTDPLVECTKCKKRFRQDHIPNEVCPECGSSITKPRQFNMMFETHFGAALDSASIAYLRPETAQGIFVNFKNIIDSFHPKLPFGIGQIGKAFRNEITPRDFIFRTREFEIMEIEYFTQQDKWENHFRHFLHSMRSWAELIGLPANMLHEVEVPEADRAHYSSKTIDFEFDFPHGRSELYGLAYRSDFDLKSHINESKVDLSIFDDETGNRIIPHVVEPTFGLDRTVFAILTAAYTEDEMGEGKRTYLKFKPEIAPVKCAVFPLLKNKAPLIAKAKEVYDVIKLEIPQTMFDDNGNIGKRYRRQDEIGTPFCVTIDFDSLEDETVTLRHRDSGEQERVKIEELLLRIKDGIKS